METLFDVTPMLDPFYAAALDFCSQLVGHRVERLEPGVPNEGNFCAIAATLAKHTDDAYDYWDDEPLTRDLIERIGGSGGLFLVGRETVVWPYARSLDLGLDIDYEAAECRVGYDTETDAYGNLWGWEFDSSGGDMLHRVVYLPPLVETFTQQFDLGGWPSFMVDLNNEREDT